MTVDIRTDPAATVFKDYERAELRDRFALAIAPAVISRLYVPGSRVSSVLLRDIWEIADMVLAGRGE